MTADPVLLQVDGMFCGSCARALQSVLERLPGVAKANVGITSGVASIWVRSDADRQRVQQIATQASTDLGYPARLWSPELVSAPASSATLQARLALGVFLGMWVMVAQLALYTGEGLSILDRELLARLAGVASTPIVFGVGSRVLLAGWRTLRAGVPGMDALVGVGAIAAWLLSMYRLFTGSTDVWFDSAAMLIVFFLLGRTLEASARTQGADAVRQLLAQAPEIVWVFRPSGWVQSPVMSIAPGDRVRLDPYAKLAVDGHILSGSSSVDCSLLTGESAAVLMKPGDTIYAGILNGAKTLELEVTSSVGQRRIDGIARQVRLALDQRDDRRTLAEKLAERWFPVVGGLALLTFLLGSFFFGTDEGLRRALSVLVITCPCAFSVATPLVSAVAIGRGAMEGILFRGGDALRRLAEVDTLAFDKTGTLTQGKPVVVAIEPIGTHQPEAILQIAAEAESGASHPLAKAINERLPSALRPIKHRGTREQIPGCGVRWTYGEHTIKVGHREWFTKLPWPASGKTEAWVEKDGILLGRLQFSDNLREEATSVIRELSASYALHLWSGDAQQVVEAVASQLGIIHHIASASPEDKAGRAKSFAKQHTLAFIGDGVNDAPALATASVGIAMGQAADTARSSASVVLSGGGLRGVQRALDLARQAKNTANWAMIWAVAYNLVALPAAMAGWVQPHWAVLAMVVSSLSVTLAAVRIGRAQPSFNRASGTTPVTP